MNVCTKISHACKLSGSINEADGTSPYLSHEFK